MKFDLDIVAFAGRSRSGKDTAAEVWRKKFDGHNGSLTNGSIILPLARALKDDVMKLGLIDYYNVYGRGDISEHTRRILQIWGTEHGRKIDERYWCLRWLDELVSGMYLTRTSDSADLRLVVVPDVRFVNEAHFLLDLGATLYYIDADERLSRIGPVLPHSSETGVGAILKEFAGHHSFRILVNDDTLEEFLALCDHEYSRWSGLEQ